MAAKRAERARRSCKDGSGSQRAVEEAQAELVAAAAALKAARDRLALASASDQRVGRDLARCAGDLAAARRLRHARADRGGRCAAVRSRARRYRVAPRAAVRRAKPTTSTRARPRASSRSAPMRRRPAPWPTPVTAPPSADPVDRRRRPLLLAVEPRRECHRASAAGTARRRARQPPGRCAASRRASRGPAARRVRRHLGLRGARRATRSSATASPLADLVNGVAVLDQGPPAGTRVVTAGAAELFGTEFGVGK